MLTFAAKKSLISLLTVVLAATALFTLPLVVNAQNSGQCSPPRFQITSSKDVTAIVNKSFTYFVVTDGEANYTLTSQLPTGLTYANGRLSGTPQETGNFPLQFTATNNCGSTTQTVMLTVVNADKLAQNTAQNNNGQQNVRLNQIPDTGISADQALTIVFYLLALLMISVIAARRLYRRSTTAATVREHHRSNPGSADRKLRSNDNHPRLD